jgi:hypothetical protein
MNLARYIIDLTQLVMQESSRFSFKLKLKGDDNVKTILTRKIAMDMKANYDF